MCTRQPNVNATHGDQIYVRHMFVMGLLADYRYLRIIYCPNVPCQLLIVYRIYPNIPRSPVMVDERKI